MALILAVNPGGTQNAALGRLARELRGHELIGADSYAVAISAIQRRMPDLVLLPPKAETGQLELLTRLRDLPVGVRILRMPVVLSTDPREFADQIRDSLSRQPGEELIVPGMASAQLLAAAAAMVAWIRARRATWPKTAAREPAPVEPSPVPVISLHRPATAPSGAPARMTPSSRWEMPAMPEPREQWTTEEPEEPAFPSFPSRGAGIPSKSRGRKRGRDVGGQLRNSIAQMLPRAAALAVVAALAWAGFTYWPSLRTSMTTGVAVLESIPAGSQVFIDGQLVGKTPIRTELPAGPHTVEFRDGARTRTANIVVIARNQVVESVNWTAKPLGNLHVNSVPSGARLFVDGKFRGTTPTTVENLPVGSHVVLLETSSGSVRRTVTIATGKTAELNESLVPGWLAVFSPFEVEISEGTRAITQDERGRAMLSPGSHVLRFRNQDLGYNEVRNVVINPTETTTLNLIPQTTISVTATEPAEVSIDGARVGSTPLSNRRVNLGTHTITVRNAAGQERQVTVTATSKPVQIEVDFSRPQ